MKTTILLILVLVVTVATVTYFQADAAGKILPKDEPNFKPKITHEIIDGRNIEVIEFKSKFAT
ncbi:hypothetical protein [Candidatus Nitrosotenuis uzonensis]|uniref:Uncharacterized protein n=1 Tax=Candidatus Nitrosotenuis uzonensis TaxID=1407055 RepID=V6AR30_9ARCH|nr:hypothetical protein [Candidatus Nitrosotenuis uzonensis]CDI05044.1 exported hypothetical protein [Candidatus Nitrosotenuis uzonensis]